MQSIERAIEEHRCMGQRRLCAARQAAARVSEGMRLVRHGGLAIEALVPGAAYADGEEAPDVDAFTSRGPNARRTAHALRQLLEREGVDGLRVVPAMHRGTFSVRLGRQPVADVSWVPERELALLRRVARDEGHAALAAPAAYLKMSMHLELSRPAVYIDRWRKVWPRLQRVYEAFPRCAAGAAGRGLEGDGDRRRAGRRGRRRWNRQGRRRGEAEPEPEPKPEPGPEPEPVAEAEGEPEAEPEAKGGLREVVLQDEGGLLREACALGCVVAGRHLVRALTGADAMSAWPADLVVPTWPDGQEQASAKDVVAALCERFGLAVAAAPGKAGLFGPAHYKLADADGEYVARVHPVETELCTAADEEAHPGVLFGSSDLLLHMLYGEYLRTADRHDANRQRLSEVIDSVVEAQRLHQDEPDGVHRRSAPFNSRLSPPS